MFRLLRRTFAIALLGALSPLAATAAAPTVPLGTLQPQLRVGDIVFIRVTAGPFLKVADATGSWTNHVGVVVDVGGTDVQVAESTLPLSRHTPLTRFIARSEAGRVAVRRLDRPLTPDEQRAVPDAASRRLGVHYDTGFDLHSRGQFCSRFVREVMQEATGTAIGDVETFGALLAAQPDADVGYWRRWFLGQIPWQRETVTPASQLRSTRLATVFDGHVAH